MPTGDILQCEMETHHAQKEGWNQCWCGFRKYPPVLPSERVPAEGGDLTGDYGSRPDELDEPQSPAVPPIIEVDPGHEYLLASYDGKQINRLVFMKREGKGYPFNTGHHPGTNCQNVERALIARYKYLDRQEPCDYNERMITRCRKNILDAELRAAKRHRRTLPMFPFDEIELQPICSGCGHIGCEGTHHSEREGEAAPLHNDEKMLKALEAEITEANCLSALPALALIHKCLKDEIADDPRVIELMNRVLPGYENIAADGSVIDPEYPPAAAQSPAVPRCEFTCSEYGSMCETAHRCELPVGHSKKHEPEDFEGHDASKICPTCRHPKTEVNAQGLCTATIKPPDCNFPPHWIACGHRCEVAPGATPPRFKVGDRVRYKKKIRGSWPEATVTEVNEHEFRYEYDEPYVLGTQLGSSTGGIVFETGFNSWELAPPIATDRPPCANCGHSDPHNKSCGAVSDCCAHIDCDCGYYSPVAAGAVAEDDGLPLVGGRRLTEWTVAEFKRNCRILIRDEQEKPNCDNRLIAVLCNAVRLAREQSDLIKQPLVPLRQTGAVAGEWADPECPTLEEAEASLRAQGIDPTQIPNQFLEHLMRRHAKLAEALRAAIHALRSYQYGNAAPELAGRVADSAEAVLCQKGK